MPAVIIMPNEESSEEEPEKFFNADREPGQAPASCGCFGALSVLLAIISLGLVETLHGHKTDPH